jgi:addiction module RelB/DinJ family antitoxin
MSKVLLNIKTDTEVKDEAKRIAMELGIPLSMVVNAYLKEFIRDRELRLTIAPKLRPEIGKILKKSSKDYKTKKGVDGPFKTAKEIIDYLHA